MYTLKESYLVCGKWEFCINVMGKYAVNEGGSGNGIFSIKTQHNFFIDLFFFYLTHTVIVMF